ncbi:hypothetical protein CVT26_003965, partial [Gymnopilus dilepis]
GPLKQVNFRGLSENLLGPLLNTSSHDIPVQKKVVSISTEVRVRRGKEKRSSANQATSFNGQPESDANDRALLKRLELSSDESGDDTDLDGPPSYRTSPKMGHVREHVKELLQSGQLDVKSDEPHFIHFPTEFEITRYALTRRQEDGPSAVDFRFQSTDNIRTPWNERLAMVFTDHFLLYGKHGYGESCRHQIARVFLTHLTTLHSRIHERLEGRVPSKQFEKENRRAKEVRKRNLLARRIDVCRFYSRDKSMQNTLEILEDLPYQVCSDDEVVDDNGQQQFAILNSEWRNPQLRTLFQILDDLYLLISSDATPRARIPSMLVDHKEAVVGLPENFYARNYVLNLDCFGRERLRLRLPREIVLSEAILRYVIRIFENMSSDS